MTSYRYTLLPILALALLFLSSCKRNFQYSVLEVKPLTRNMNLKAIERIQELVPKDTFSFLFISDTQIAYAELQDFVEFANNNLSLDSISFVLHGGDYSDYGANFEFNLYYDDIRKLKFPVVGVIGNHDMLGNGSEVYRRYFGPDDFTFNFGSTKFIAFNSNSREASFDGTLPNLNWIKSQQHSDEDIKNIIYLAHVPPYSSDFDPNIQMPYAELLANESRSLLSLHGHTHTYLFDQPYDDGMNYLVAPSLISRSFILVTVEGNTAHQRLITF
ncbi:MAG: metallophosphoesterase family protein [Sphingobacterium sp.]